MTVGSLRTKDGPLLGGILSATVLALAWPACGAAAQEFSQVQSLTSHVLFAKEDAAALQREAERRRIEELDRRAQQQASLLAQQAVSVQQLGQQLQFIREEKRLVDIADAFDAALLAGHVSAARALLADDVTIAVGRETLSPLPTIPADTAVTMAPLSTAVGGVLPRSNQRVEIDGDNARLVSDGYAWSRSVQQPLEQRAGTWTYSFVRSQGEWRIVGINFLRRV